MKLLILILIVYLAYRAGRSWVTRTLQPPGTPGTRGGPGGDIDDVMIQDPVCGIHFPRREGVVLEHDGQTLHFCSTACRDRYLEEHPPRA